MKGLVRIYNSIDREILPYFLVELGGTTAPALTVDEKSLVLEKQEARIAEIIPEHYCDGMKPDGDGVFWIDGGCLYVEDAEVISDSDAAHLERLLCLSTF